MHYTHCFFDMDGTVINSALGVTRAVAFALEQCGITPPPIKELTCFIGPPLVWSFANFYGMNEEETQKALAFYRQYYTKKGITECEVYEGVEELLQALKQHGIVCVMATSKPHIFASEILRQKGLDGYFSFVSGPEFDGTRNAKDEVIAYAMEQMNLCDPSKILMIGDRNHDTLGAKKHGLDAVGVLWGFGTREELLESGALAVFETAKELENALLSPTSSPFSQA